MRTKTSLTRNSVNRSPLRHGLLLIACVGVVYCAFAEDAGTAIAGTGWPVRENDNYSTGDAPFHRENSNDPDLVTIFSNLASKYPKGVYWCCSGYNVMGPNSGAGEQWMAAAFTPDVDRTVTKIEVAAGWSDGTNGIVISLNNDNNGMPGPALKMWNVSNLTFFGTCCTLLKVFSQGIPVTGGQQYWVMLSTSGSELNTVDAWNVSDADQVDQATIASFTSNEWNVFQAAPGVAFAVKGN